MEEKVTVKLEAKADISEVDKLRLKIMALKGELQSAQYVMKHATTGAEYMQASRDVLAYENELKSANKELKDMTKETSKLARTSRITFSGTGKQLTATTKKISKYMLSLLSLRSVYSLISKSARAYLGVDTQLSNKLQSAWIGLGAVLSPALEYLANLLTKVVSYINAFVTALSGIDYVARANALALKNQTSAIKQLKNATTGLDELNIISQETGGGGGSVNTFKPEPVDLEKIKQATSITSTLWEDFKMGAGAFVVGLEYEILSVIEIFKSLKTIIIDIILGIITSAKAIFKGAWLGIQQIAMAPINGIITFIKSIISGVTKIIQSFKDGDWSKVWEGIKDIALSPLRGLLTAVKSTISGILTIGKGLAVGFQNIVIGIFNGVVELLNATIRAINKIKIPDWVPLVGGKGFSLPEISKMSYKELTPVKLAVGGITNRSVLANIGEAGQEAVIPLTNQNAMDKLGRIIGEYTSNVGNNTQPIQVTSVVQLDRKTIATAVNRANYESGATLTKGAFAL